MPSPKILGHIAFKIGKYCLLAGVAVALLVAGCSGRGGGVRPGQPAPSFTLPTLAGPAVSLSDFQGRPVLINFWASWCGPCRQEMPILQAVADEKAAEDLAIILVDIREDRTTIENFVKELGLRMMVAMDQDGQVAERYGVSGIPATFLVDRQGIIRFVQVGAFASQEELRAKLALIR